MTLAIDISDGWCLSNEVCCELLLEYRDGLNKRNKFVCVAMCSLVMSLCPHDIINYYYNTLNSS